MLIPENGKWRWNGGPLCDTKDEALSTATMDEEPKDDVAFTMDSIESLELE